MLQRYYFMYITVFMPCLFFQVSSLLLFPCSLCLDERPKNRFNDGKCDAVSLTTNKTLSDEEFHVNGQESEAKKEKEWGRLKCCDKSCLILNC